MSELSDKISYVKGMCEGMDIKPDTPEHKLMLAMLDALEAVGDEIKLLHSKHDELEEYVDMMDEDIGELESEMFGGSDDLDLDDEDEDEDDDCDDDCDCDCDEDCDCGCHHDHDGFDEAMMDQELAERDCPNCGKSIGITMRALLKKDEPIVCPHCGSKFRAHEPDDE